MTLCRRLLVCVAVNGLGLASAFADSVMIPANKDNTLYEDATGSLSNGAGPFLYVGKTGLAANQLLRRSVIAFDVAGSIPAGSTINSVSLTLTRDTPLGQGPVTVTLHKVTADWGEGMSNAGSPGGAGAPSTTMDATWIHRFFNTSNWTTAGADFMATASASLLVGATNGPYTWGSTPQMVADVQSWLDGGNNFGWAIRGDEVTVSSAIRICTKENPTPANRPVLTVEYTPGAPALGGSAVLVLATVLTLSAAWVLRRRTARVAL